MKEFVSLKIGKKTLISVIIATVSKEDKILYQKHESFIFELPLIKLSGMDKYKVTKNVSAYKVNFQKCKVVLAHSGNWNCRCIYGRLTFPDIKYLFGASVVSDF